MAGRKPKPTAAKNLEGNFTKVVFVRIWVAEVQFFMYN